VLQLGMDPRRDQNFVKKLGKNLNGLDQNQIIDRGRVGNNRRHRESNPSNPSELRWNSSKDRALNALWSFEKTFCFVEFQIQQFTDLATGQFTSPVALQSEHLQRATIALLPIEVQLRGN
jgi:hypothetical protein